MKNYRKKHSTYYLRTNCDRLSKFPERVGRIKEKLLKALHGEIESIKKRQKLVVDTMVVL